MNKILDFILCCGVTWLEVIGIIMLALLIQGVLYRTKGINLYKSIIKWLDKQDKKMSMYLYGYER